MISAVFNRCPIKADRDEVSPALRLDCEPTKERPGKIRRIAIYGATVEARHLIGALESDPSVLVAGIFEQRSSMERRDAPELPLAGTLADLCDAVSADRIDEVIIALPRSALGRAQEIVSRLQQQPVDVRALDTTAKALGFAAEGEATRVGLLGLVQLFVKPRCEEQRFAKTIQDRVIGVLGLLALSPIFLIIALAIKLDSSGPVFFRQRRNGRGGAEFEVWKFRTMRVMENGTAVRQATKNDPRVTRVGRVLRKTSLDELPQLINVVLGTMSIVGPRPHAVAHNVDYGARIPHYLQRHRVRPGITGWAQINGFRGETQSVDQMAARAEHDLWYIANWSVWLDLKIILLTPIYGFVGRNAY